MDIIEKAIQIAAIAHENQYRKSTEIPYITHPYTVGMILMKHGYSNEVVAAGILHDTVEDTALTLWDIRNEFGPQIVELVRGTSEEDKDLSWEERKQKTIDSLENASVEICAIVCADKLHNLRSIHEDLEQNGERVWDRFKRGRTQQEWYYKSVYKQLEKPLLGHVILTELKNEINRVF